MSVLGLDASLTGTGYCLINGESVKDHGTIKSKLRGVERLIDIRAAVGDILESAGKIDLICLEGYSFGSQGRAVFQIGELGGVLRCLMFDNGIKWVEVAPSTLKKFACGKGNVKKDQIALHVYKRWGFTSQDNNVADAYVLARIGQELLEPSGEVTKAQAEVLQTVVNSI